MCSYLDQVGATYYFRRAVPGDLIGRFLTNTGRPRTEWKFSLGTKDRETAKRLLRPHEIETDALIDNAREDLRQPVAAEESHSVMQRDERTSILAEEAEASAAQEAARQARYEARKDFRVAARQRMTMSTAELSPRKPLGGTWFTKEALNSPNCAKRL